MTENRTRQLAELRQDGGMIRMIVENGEIMFEWDESLTYFTVDYEQALVLHKNLGEAIDVLKNEKALQN